MLLKVFVFERLLHKIFFSHSPSVQAGGKIVPFGQLSVILFVNQAIRKRLTLNEDSTIKLIFQFSKNKLKSKRIPRPLTIRVISYFSITRKSNNRRPNYTTSSRATNLAIVKKPTRINSSISLDDNTNNTHGFKIHLQYEFEICFGIEQISLQVLCLVPYNNNSRNKVILKVNLLTCRAEVVEL